MNTLQKTISMIEKLPEADLIQIQDLIRKLFQQHEYDNAVGRAFKPMSKKDFLEDIETAEKEIAEGKYRKAEEVLDGLEQKYGF